MNSTDQIAWIDCEHPGCDAGLAVDARHARNFDGRSYCCAEHEQENR